jgi:hypothetical protein
MTAGHSRTLPDTSRCKEAKSLILRADTSSKSVRRTNCPRSVRGHDVRRPEVTHGQALTPGGHFVRTLRFNTSGGHTPPFRGVSAVRQEEKLKRHRRPREVCRASGASYENRRSQLGGNRISSVARPINFAQVPAAEWDWSMNRSASLSARAGSVDLMWRPSLTGPEGRI